MTEMRQGPKSENEELRSVLRELRRRCHPDVLGPKYKNDATLVTTILNACGEADKNKAAAWSSWPGRNNPFKDQFVRLTLQRRDGTIAQAEYAIPISNSPREFIHTMEAYLLKGELPPRPDPRAQATARQESTKRTHRNPEAKERTRRWHAEQAQREEEARRAQEEAARWKNQFKEKFAAGAEWVKQTAEQAGKGNEWMRKNAEEQKAAREKRRKDRAGKEENYQKQLGKHRADIANVRTAEELRPILLRIVTDPVLRDRAPHDAMLSKDGEDLLSDVYTQAGLYFKNRIGEAKFRSELADIKAEIGSFFGVSMREGESLKPNVIRINLSAAQRSRLSPEQIQAYNLSENTRYRGIISEDERAELLGTHNIAFFGPSDEQIRRIMIELNSAIEDQQTRLRTRARAA